MSSLTNLERKSEAAIAATPLPPPTPQTSPTDVAPSLPLHRHYNLALFASTDHLRSSPSTPNTTRSPAMASALSGALSNGFRGRYSNSFSSGLGISNGSTTHKNNFDYAEAATPIASGNNSPRTNAIRAFRSGVSVNTTPRTGRASSSASTTSLLWSPVVKDEEAMEDEDEDFDMLLDFPEAKPSLPNGNGQANGNGDSNGFGVDGKAMTPREERTMPTPPPEGSLGVETEERDGLASLGLGAGTGGLWGQPKLNPGIERLKGLSSPKRRWTVNERT